MKLAAVVVFYNPSEKNIQNIKKYEKTLKNVNKYEKIIKKC